MCKIRLFIIYLYVYFFFCGHSITVTACENCDIKTYHGLEERSIENESKSALNTFQPTNYNFNSTITTSPYDWNKATRANLNESPKGVYKNLKEILFQLHELGLDVNSDLPTILKSLQTTYNISNYKDANLSENMATEKIVSLLSTNVSTELMNRFEYEEELTIKADLGYEDEVAVRLGNDPMTTNSSKMTNTRSSTETKAEENSTTEKKGDGGQGVTKKEIIKNVFPSEISKKRSTSTPKLVKDTETTMKSSVVMRNVKIKQGHGEIIRIRLLRGIWVGGQCHCNFFIRSHGTKSEKPTLLIVLLIGLIWKFIK